MAIRETDASMKTSLTYNESYNLANKSADLFMSWLIDDDIKNYRNE